MKIKKIINHVVITFIAIVCSVNVNFAQDSSKVSLDFGADVVSRYVWRGTQFGGASPSVQPTAELGIGNFVLGTFGAYSLGGLNPFQELDFYAGYSFLDGKVSITVIDYYFPDESTNYNYLDYDAGTTGHIFEATVSFNGTEKIPFSALVAVNVFGADATRISNAPATLNAADGIQYSTYLELGFTTAIKSVGFDVFLGFNFTDARKSDAVTGYLGESGVYGDDIGVVNFGFTISKEIGITDKFSLPVMTSVISNPQAQTIFMVFGFSL